VAVVEILPTKPHRFTQTYSSKDHWLCLPLYFCGIPLSRARCITDPIGSKGRAFVFKHGCSNIVADASVIKHELVQEQRR